jgi:phosphoribosyl 1,2-cyclic phosphodiesterase
MRVTFWGVRGTFPATGARFVRYGGDTMCIEVECGATRLILDAGTGLRSLGEKLAAEPPPVKAHVLLSHAHLDHLMGFVQFAPLWRADTSIKVWSMAGEDDDPGEAAQALLKPPFTPAGASAFPAQVDWMEIEPGLAFEPAPGVRVTPFQVNHPGGACGFRIDHAGRSVCYITDHEHGESEADERLAQAAKGADLIIYDATFTEEEIEMRRGWGHSTWQAGMRLRDRSRGKLVAFAHHEPRRADDDLDRLASAAARAGANAVFAREGLSIDL